MKRLFSILFFLLFFVISFTAFAHPPSELALEFDKKTNTLIITFKHKVRNSKDHFVYNVKTQLNKTDIIEQILSSQDNNEGGSLVYKIIDIKKSDKIKVRLRCNKTGNKTETIIIE